MLRFCFCARRTSESRYSRYARAYTGSRSRSRNESFAIFAPPETPDCLTLPLAMRIGEARTWWPAPRHYLPFSVTFRCSRFWRMVTTAAATAMVTKSAIKVMATAFQTPDEA